MDRMDKDGFARMQGMPVYWGKIRIQVLAVRMRIQGIIHKRMSDGLAVNPYLMGSSGLMTECKIGIEMLRRLG